MAISGQAADGVSRTEMLRLGKTDSTDEEPPSSGYLTWMHSLAPYRSANDLHHRIGTNAYDAAAGNHQHRGTDASVPLFDSSDAVSGDLSTDAGIREALKDVIGLLRTLGASDSTTN